MLPVACREVTDLLKEEEQTGTPREAGMTSDPQVQPNVPGQDGWLIGLAMPIISIYEPKYVARRSLEIS